MGLTEKILSEAGMNLVQKEPIGRGTHQMAYSMKDDSKIVKVKYTDGDGPDFDTSEWKFYAKHPELYATVHRANDNHCIMDKLDTSTILDEYEVLLDEVLKAEGGFFRSKSRQYWLFNDALQTWANKPDEFERAIAKVKESGQLENEDLVERWLDFMRRIQKVWPLGTNPEMGLIDLHLDQIGYDRSNVLKLFDS